MSARPIASCHQAYLKKIQVKIYIITWQEFKEMYILSGCGWATAISGYRISVLVMLIWLHIVLIIIIWVSSTPAHYIVLSFTQRKLLVSNTQHFLQKHCERKLTTKQKQNNKPLKYKLTRARTTHCLRRHFWRILFGPPNFFMSLQKSHWPQSSVLVQGSHSPHIRAERFTWNAVCRQ